MRAVSEVLTTMIMISIVLTVGLTIAYFAITTIGNAVATASYELSVNAFTALTSNYDLIVNGGSYMVEFPERDVGLGYNLTGKRLEVVVNVSTQNIVLVNDSSIYEVYIKGPNAVGARESILYGRGGLIVDSPSLLPILVEHYIPGKGQYIVLNTSRISLFTSSYITDSTNVTILYIVYSDLSPSVLGGGSARRLKLALVSMASNESTRNITSPTTINITVTLYNNNGQVIQTESRLLIVSNTILKIYYRELTVSAVIS